ncbi:MAG: leucine-rich repeat protein [Muribaculaceae bacterium]|nr:leucine-rich repeat protein [Muribaculaceae bacterium]
MQNTTEVRQDDGDALYSEDGKILIKGPKNVSSYIVNNGTEIIGSHAFRGNQNIKEVCLPESCKEVQGLAFKFSTLEKIHFPSVMDKIGFEAFKGSLLEELNIPEGIEEIEGICVDCFKLKKVHLPLSMKIIGAESFYRCKNLREINLPEGLIEIRTHAFFQCENLTSIRFPDSLEKFDIAFNGCTNLKEIIISKNKENPLNRYWTSSMAPVGHCNIGIHTHFPKLRYDGETIEEMEKRHQELRLQYEKEKKARKHFKLEDSTLLKLIMDIKYGYDNRWKNLFFKLNSQKMVFILKDLDRKDLIKIFKTFNPEETASIVSRLLKNSPINDINYNTKIYDENEDEEDIDFEFYDED